MGRRAQGWTLGRDARTGKYLARFRVSGRRYCRSTGATDRAVAQAEASRIYREVGEGRRRETQDLATIDVADVCAEWLVAMSAEVSEATIACWTTYVDAHWIPFFASAENLTSEARLADYMRARLERVTRSTVKKEMSALRRFLGWAVERGYLDDAPQVPTPSRRATGTPHPKGKRVRVELAGTMMDAIIAALPDTTPTGYRIKAFFVVLRETAFRPGTLYRVTAPDDYRRGAEVLRIRADADKARYGREVPLTQRARAALDSVCPDEGILFERFEYREILREAALAAGLPKDLACHVSAYDFRHGRTTELLENSSNLTGVAYLVGHKHVSTTDRYAHARQHAAEEVLATEDLERRRPNSGYRLGYRIPKRDRAMARAIAILQRSRSGADERTRTSTGYPTRSLV